MKKIILCTGGTGGHIFPMIALYEELKKNHNVKIVTDQRALKYLDLKQDLTIIAAESPYRKKGMFHFIKSIFIIGLSVIKSFLHSLLRAWYGSSSRLHQSAVGVNTLAMRVA